MVTGALHLTGSSRVLMRGGMLTGSARHSNHRIHREIVGNSKFPETSRNRICTRSKVRGFADFLFKSHLTELQEYAGKSRSKSESGIP